MTVMGDALMDELSDRGSIPLRSTIAHRYEPEILIFRTVFALTIKQPED